MTYVKDCTVSDELMEQVAELGLGSIFSCLVSST
jgi:hypothetical protein